MIWLLVGVIIILSAVYIWAMIDAAPEISAQFEEQRKRLRNGK